MSSEFRPQDERDALVKVLDRQREALIRKVVGVSDANARRVPAASSLSLLALLKHSAIWEARWFQGVFEGRTLDDGWPDREESVPDADFVLEVDDTVDVWLGRYRAAVTASRAVAAGSDLGAGSVRIDVLDCNLR